MKNTPYSRRKFIYKCFSTSSIFFGTIIILDSCDSKKPSTKEKKVSTSKEPCEDLSEVSAEEIAKRQKFAYVKQSPDPERNCGNCSLHLPPVNGKECGGCLLFKGPVDPAGYCIQYAAKV
jgi:hypothetical protein